MNYCKKCVMPDTRPGLLFTDGVCIACLHAEQKYVKTDYNQRWKELEELCDKYRGINGDGYDCAIAVSGGKDSHTQVYHIKKRLGMNPLLITVEHFSWTETGRKNIKNLCDTSDFALPDYDVDAFNAQAVERFHHWSERAILESFERARVGWVSFIENLPDSAFENKKITHRLYLELLFHMQEHALPLQESV